MSYIGNSPGVASQRVVTTFTATSGQTSFTPSSGYTLGYCDVYYNGVKLVAGDDYTAADGVSVVLASGAAANDVIEVVAHFPRGLSDGYLKSEADSRFLSSTDGSVTTAKLASNAVTTAKITDANVTAAKLASGAAVSNIGYTPANKAGDTFTGKATFGDSTSSTAAISLVNGSADVGTGRSHQLEFGYNGNPTYRHVIKTRHNGGSYKDNAMEFRLWTAAETDVNSIGSRNVMTLDGTGTVYMPLQPVCHARVNYTPSLADGESFTATFGSGNFASNRGGFSASGGKIILPATGTWEVMTMLEGSIDTPQTYSIRATSPKLRVNAGVADTASDRWHSVANVGFSNTHYTFNNTYIISAAAGDGLDIQTWFYHNKGSNITPALIICLFAKFLG
jgi:hypothetical protein